MGEVWFYHLERTSLDQALPGLLEKTLQRGWRALVQTGTSERAEAISTQLWTYRDETFLPHGTVADGEPDAQPVLIVSEPLNLNGAQVLLLVDPPGPDDLAPARLASFARTILIFDGKDEVAVAAARQAWRSAQGAGLPIAYWQQNAQGKWEQRA